MTKIFAWIIIFCGQFVLITSQLESRFNGSSATTPNLRKKGHNGSFHKRFLQFINVNIPTIEVPTIEVPTVEVPAIEVPTIEAPTIEVPTTEVPNATTITVVQVNNEDLDVVVTVNGTHEIVQVNNEDVNVEVNENNGPDTLNCMKKILRSATGD